MASHCATISSILDFLQEAEQATRQLGFDLGEIADAESDAPLGMEALAGSPHASWNRSPHSGMPAYGFGINYQFGLFKQEIEDGFQKEKADQWLSYNSPWLIERSGRDLHHTALWAYRT